MSNALSIFRGPQNLSAKERAISVVAGLGLAAAGSKPRPNPVLNVVALLSGAYLAVRGATGHCPIKQVFMGPSEMLPVVAKVPAKRVRRVVQRQRARSTDRTDRCLVAGSEPSLIR